MSWSISPTAENEGSLLSSGSFGSRDIVEMDVKLVFHKAGSHVLLYSGAPRMLIRLIMEVMSRIVEDKSFGCSVTP